MKRGLHHAVICRNDMARHGSVPKNSAAICEMRKDMRENMHSEVCEVQR